MPKYYKTVSVNLESNLFEKFKKICRERGCTGHSILHDYIEDLIEMEAEEHEREKRKLEGRNEENIEGGTEEPSPFE